MVETLPWLPQGPMYLDAERSANIRPHRPWNQGDIFESSLVVLDRIKGRDPKEAAKSRAGYVALLGNPCSLRAGARPVALQNIAQAREAKEKEKEHFADLEEAGRPWDGRYQLFPLPELMGNELWVVDFNVIGTTHYKNLEGRRVACLTKEGWAAFQVRYSYHSLRQRPALEVVAQDVSGTWNELSVWERWRTNGGSDEHFESWLNLPLQTGVYAGTERKDALEFACDSVLSEVPPDASVSTSQ